MKRKILPAAWQLRFLFPLILVFLGALLPYLQTFNVPFHFDDTTNIADNRVIHDLQRFLGGEGFRYNPRRFIGYLTLALNYHFGGLSVASYHAVNLAIHALTALLVYALVYLTLQAPRLQGSALKDRAPALALVVALLFAVHPIQTEAITYIVQRFTSLATMFYLLALVLYAWGRLEVERGRREAAEADTARRWRGLALTFAGAIAAAVLALLTKEIAVTLPLAVLLYEVSFFRTPWRRLLCWLAPPVALLAIVSVGLAGSIFSSGEEPFTLDQLPRDSALISRTDYLLTQFRVIVTYLRLLFFPAGQNLDYDYPIYRSALAPPVFLSALLLLGLFVLALWLYRPTNEVRTTPDSQSAPAETGSFLCDPALRLAAFGICWFFLTLAVTSSIIPIRDVIVEHRLYLPSFGIVLAAVSISFLALRRKPRLLYALTIFAVAALAMATWQRNEIWQDARRLWGDAAAKSPNKGRPAHNYAMALSAAGESALAIEQFRHALAVGSPSAETVVNLAAEYEKVGQRHLAEKYLRWGLAENPRDVKALTRLAIILLQRGDGSEGIGLLLQAERLEPRNANVHFNLGAAYESQGRLREAEEHYRRAAALDRGYAKAYNALGALCFHQGRVADAERHFEAALAADSGLIEAYGNLALVYQTQGRTSLAARVFREAELVRKPSDR